MGVIARLRKLERQQKSQPFDAVEYIDFHDGEPEKPIPAERPGVLRINYDIVTARNDQS